MGNTFTDFFDSGNLFILFLTLLFFFVVEIFFFLEVVSQETPSIIEKQARITSDLIAPTTSTADLQQTKADLEASLPALKASADASRKRKKDDLYERARETFFLPVGAVAVLVLVFLVIAIGRKNLHMPDYIAVFLVAFSFVTELILYFMVLSNIDYVDDITMLARLSVLFQGVVPPFPVDDKFNPFTPILVEG